MKVFLTAATGYIDTIVARRLKEEGYDVVGFARSLHSVQKLSQLQIEPKLRTLEDFEILIDAVRDADAIIHTAFIHNFRDFANAERTERKVIAAFTEAIQG